VDPYQSIENELEKGVQGGSYADLTYERPAVLCLSTLGEGKQQKPLQGGPRMSTRGATLKTSKIGKDRDKKSHRVNLARGVRKQPGKKSM